MVKVLVPKKLILKVLILEKLVLEMLISKLFALTIVTLGIIVLRMLISEMLVLSNVWKYIYNHLESLSLSNIILYWRPNYGRVERSNIVLD